MFADKLSTAAFAAMLVLATTVPAAAAGTSAATDSTATESITVTVRTTQDSTVLTVERAGEASVGSTVDVDAVGGATYDGSGSYETNANGSIVLPTPDADVSVRVAVGGERGRVSGVVVLSAYQGEQTERTHTLGATGNADGEADAATAERRDGSEANSDAGDRTERSAEANGDAHVSLGERLASFISGIVHVDLGGIGEAVSNFAIGHNQAAADDDAKDRGDTQAAADGSAAANVDARADAGASAAAGAGNASIEAGDGRVDVEANGSIGAGATADADGGSDADGEGTASAGAETDTGTDSSESNAGGDADASARTDWSFGLFG